MPGPFIGGIRSSDGSINVTGGGITADIVLNPAAVTAIAQAAVPASVPKAYSTALAADVTLNADGGTSVLQWDLFDSEGPGTYLVWAWATVQFTGTKAVFEAAVTTAGSSSMVLGSASLEMGAAADAVQVATLQAVGLAQVAAVTPKVILHVTNGSLTTTGTALAATPGLQQFVNATGMLAVLL